ncbi:Di-/tripeptide transporter [Polystyrenella longa]|uniref:Di-/tripeptide transporter n=1 Tax=Polystyrenella longa TaxID=2528007 RepID=A0A518CPI1_9PLAN|nr:POT family MFS transporter [Polystyrenella longa]QDU81104.1 Di-/tripeptide transporter [Polystyrenella longa]
MSEKTFRTTPTDSSGMPSGIPYIIGNEVAERFSYYGMKAILTVFMTEYLINSSGELALMSDGEAKKAIHLFTACNYFTPIIGAIVADWLFGKYKTILWLSIVYCLGHLALALDETRFGLTVGLTLLAIGSGGIKPCVSAHVGDQFGRNASHRFNQVFNWFYYSINIGAFASTLLTPILLHYYGPSVAFGVPGLLMLIATFIFWFGRNEFVHIPPKGKQFWQELAEPKTQKAILGLIPIYILVSIFWSCFDQTASAWVLQAKAMENQLGDLVLFGAQPFNWLPEWWSEIEIRNSQMQAANPLLILILVPLYAKVIYPLINKIYPLTYLRKMSLGTFLCTAAFGLTSLIQHSIDTHAPGHVHILMQLIPYVLLTMSEVMVSITCLEFSYTQAPNNLKSFVMSFYLLSVSLGNFITYLVNLVITRDDGTQMLEGADYYWFFTGLAFLSALALTWLSMRYREVLYVQGPESTEPKP